MAYVHDGRGIDPIFKNEDEVREFCKKLPTYFMQGQSQAEVCSSLNISQQTFMNYRKMYPILEDAYQLAITHAEAYWTRRGKDGTFGDGEVNAPLYKFQMTNRFGWGEKVQTEVTGKDGSALSVTLTKADVSAFDKEFDNDY